MYDRPTDCKQGSIQTSFFSCFTLCFISAQKKTFCLVSALAFRQTIHMKSRVLFSQKNKKVIKMQSAAVVISPLKIKTPRKKLSL